jgi:hypothetical protein
MKRYTAATIALLLASALLTLGTLRSFREAGRSAAGLAAARTAMNAARETLIATRQAAEAAKARGESAARFLDTWNLQLAGAASIEEIFGRLDTIAVNDLLSPSGKNFVVSPNYFFNGRHMPVQSVNITVAGDYYRTLNWLGAVEYAFPLARVEQISYTTNANTLSLAVQFVFPRKFDAE